jgi:membrane protein DedA with SNARE-associated domain
MGALVDRLLAAVETGGAAALAVVMFVENVFPPIPSEAILPLAGFVVGRGQMAFLVALGAATAGSVLGALVLYAVGRYGGRPLLLRHHWLLRLDDAALDRGERWFDRYGGSLVLWGRMVPLVRSAASVPAGMARMGVLRFVALTTAGSLGWNALLIGGGVLLGARWEQVAHVAATYGGAVLLVGALAALGLAARAVARRRRLAHCAAADAMPAGTTMPVGRRS